MIVANQIVGDSRVQKMAKAMARVTNETVLVGIFRSEDPKAKPIRSKIEGVETIQFPWPSSQLVPLADESPEDLKFRRQQKALEEWERQVLEFALGFKPTLLHTHDYMTLRLGHSIRKTLAVQLNESSWIHDVHEYMVGLLDRDEDPFQHAMFGLGIHFEREFLPSADCVFTVSEALRDALLEQYPNIGHVSVIHNAPTVAPNPRFVGKSLRETIGVGGRLLAAYVGGVKPPRGVHKIIPLLREMPELEFAVVTNNSGPYVEEIKAQALVAQVEGRLHWHPYVAPSRIVSFLEGVDIGLIPIDQYGNSNVSLPNKLFEYAFAGAQILSADLTAIRAFLGEWSIGRITDFSDPKAAARDLKTLLREAKDPRLPHEIRSLKIKLAWEVQEANVIETYRGLLGLTSATVVNSVSKVSLPAEDLKIFQGLSGAAGQPHILATALNQLPGISARSLSISKSPFGYRSDLVYPVARKRDAALEDIELFKSVADSFDIFHFHFRPFFHYPRTLEFPALLDLIALKAGGKGVVFHWRGSEARIRSIFAAKNPHHYVLDPSDRIAKSFPEPQQKQFIASISSVADRVFVNDPETASYVPGAKIIERAIDLTEWPMVGLDTSPIPLVVHAPTRRYVKGTHFVLEAVAALRREGLQFDFQLVEGLPQEQAKKFYSRADIVIDQLRIGWYGVLAVECMALGKPVIAYIRDDLLDHFPGELPLANANPITLTAVLRALIKSPAERKRLSVAGRAYVEKVHDARLIAHRLRDEYMSIIESPKKLNPGVLMDLFAAQIVGATPTQKATPKRKPKLALRTRIAKTYRRGGSALLVRHAFAQLWGARRTRSTP